MVTKSYSTPVGPDCYKQSTKHQYLQGLRAPCCGSSQCGDTREVSKDGCIFSFPEECVRSINEEEYSGNCENLQVKEGAGWL